MMVEVTREEWNQAIARIERSLNTISENLADIAHDTAQHGVRIENQGAHILAIQDKLDKCGIDGTRRIDEGITTTQAVGVGGFVLTLIGLLGSALVYLFTNFTRKP
jgi:hypothetical protein